MKYKISELTSSEAKDCLGPDTVILLPLGSLEDQGVHAPMGDYRAAEMIAEKIAERASESGVPTFCAPVIAFGSDDFFAKSHGGIALQPATFTALLNDVIASLHRHGFQRILLINGHGGNMPGIRDVAFNWRREHGLVITTLYLWEIAYGLLKDMMGEEDAAAVCGHGADPLTSVGMFMYPELLRMDLAVSPPPHPKFKKMEVAQFGVLKYQGAPVHAPTEAEEVASDGIFGGSPKLSSADRGAELVNKLTEIGAGYIREHVAGGLGDS